MKTVVLHDLGHAWTFGQLSNALQDLDVQPKHVLHVGAHLGQEVPHYRAAGIERITLVEPTPVNAEHLRVNFPEAAVIEAACGLTSGDAPLHIGAGDGAWNTLRDAAGPLVIVAVVTVAQIQGLADMLVVDTQGTELEVLMSADLSRLELVVVETNVAGSPDAASLDDVTAYMADCDWRLALLWSHDRPGDSAVGFRDAFYVRAA